MGLKPIKENGNTLSEKDFGIPYTGGNSFSTKVILDTQEVIDDNDLRQSYSLIMDKVAGSIENKTYVPWMLLQFQADYFTSLMRVKMQTQEMNQKVYECFRINFLYGNCGIFKEPASGKAWAVYEKNSKYNNAGELVEVEFCSIKDMLQNQDSNKEVYNNYDTIAKLTNEEDIKKYYARLPLNSCGFGAIVRWWPFIIQQTEILKKIYLYSYAFTRKMEYIVNDPTASAEDIRLYFNDNIPFLIRNDTNLGMGNAFKWSDTGSAESGVEEVIKYYNAFLNFYYELLGRKTNVDTKNERNVVMEVESSQTAFEILENETRINRIFFLDRITELFGEQWEDLDQKDEEFKEQEMDKVLDDEL